MSQDASTRPDPPAPRSDNDHSRVGEMTWQSTLSRLGRAASVHIAAELPDPPLVLQRRISLQNC